MASKFGGKAKRRAVIGTIAAAMALACGQGERRGPSDALFLEGEGLDFTEPVLAAAPDGVLALAFLAFDGARDRVLVSLYREGGWSPPITLTEPGAHFSPQVTVDPLGGFFVIWSSWDGARSTVSAARVQNGRPEAVQEISQGSGTVFAPCAAGGADGSLWVAWQARRGRRFEVFARRRDAASWGPEIQVSDHPESDIQPAIAIARDGTVWIAWTSWRDGRYADGNYEIYARRLDPISAPRKISISPRSDMLPAFAQLPEGLALVWTESTFPLKPAVADISTVAYDRWAEKSYRVVRIEGDQVGPPQEILLGPNQPTGSTVSVQPVPLRGASGADLWLLFGERHDANRFGFDSRWELRLARTSRDSVSAAVDLSAAISSQVAHYAGVWSGDALWIADEVERRVPAETGRPYSALRVRQLADDRLPDPKPASVPPQNPKRPINPKLALDRAPGPRGTVHHAGNVWQAYFGNLHLHSDLSGDLRGFEGRPEDNLQILEDLPRLDFGALSDHAETLRPVDWWATRKLTEMWNRPGEFVTFPGYEWTSLDYGHRVVLFPDEQVGDRDALLAAVSEDPPTRLWSHLGGRVALTIPHHPSQALRRPVDWSFRDDRFQRLVEIFQSRGSYEFDGAPLNPNLRSEFIPGHSVRHALAMGHRLGFIASPDHGGGLGLAGAWARELTREGLFEALHERRTFGTTGAKLELFLTVGGAAQGSEAPRGAGPIPIEARVRGTVPGLELTIVRDGREVLRRTFTEAQAHWTWIDEDRTPGPRYYYLRARQSDGHLGWTSPVWLDP
jgi:hypothetical protein